jgi:hypothetical protein
MQLRTTALGTQRSQSSREIHRIPHNQSVFYVTDPRLSKAAEGNGLGLSYLGWSRPPRLKAERRPPSGGGGGGRREPDPRAWEPWQGRGEAGGGGHWVGVGWRTRHDPPHHCHWRGRLRSCVILSASDRRGDTLLRSPPREALTGPAWIIFGGA